MRNNPLSWLPHIPISANAGLLISALLVSLTVALITLIRKRRDLVAPTEDTGDMGVIFENPSALMPHIIELRQRIFYSLIAIGIAMLLGTILAEQILDVLAEPIGGVGALQAIRVTESFSIFFRVALTTGIVLASPYVIAQLWLFVASGLRPKERRLFYLFFPFAIILFLTGVGFAYLAMLPVAVPFLTTFMGIQAAPTLEDYVKFVTNVLLWVGLSFELPIIIFGLARAGIVNAKMLLKNWRIAILLIAVLSAVITPTPDPINMGIIAAPLFVLYMLSIVLALFA